MTGKRVSTKKYRSTWRRIVRRALQSSLLQLWLKSNVTIGVSGLDNVSKLPPNEAFIIMANHQSHLDTPLVVGTLPAKIASRLAIGAASDYFFKNYLQSKPTRMLFNTYPIERGSNKKHQGLSNQLVADGVPILVFPEGTRSRTGELGEFHTGLARIALENKVSILPVAMIGNGRAWPVGRSKPITGKPKIVINYLPIITPTEKDTPESLTKKVRQIISRHMS